MNISPSSALQQLKAFIARVERLQANQYSDLRFRKADLNKLRSELRSIGQKVEHVVQHRKPENVQPVLDVLKEYSLQAMDIAIDDVREQMNAYMERPDATMDIIEQWEVAIAKMLVIKASTKDMPGFEDALKTRP